jgi:hypothetical protein
MSHYHTSSYNYRTTDVSTTNHTISLTGTTTRHTAPNEIACIGDERMEEGS